MANAPIPKPFLRGHVKAYIVRSFLISTVLAISAGYAYKKLVAEPRKQAYRDFYKTYNAEAEGDRLYRMGLVRGWADNEDVPEQKYKLPI